MLKFVFGTYQHQVGEVDVSRRREIVRSTASNRVLGFKHRLTLNGTLLGDGVSSIDLAVSKLIAAYNKSVSFCGMVDSVTGAPIPSFWFKAVDSLSGILVMSGPSFPSGNETQHVTMYGYQIELEVTTVLDSGAANIREFSETLSFEGGGPSYLHLEPLYGIPVKVLAKQNTVFRVRQSGRSVGWLSRPAPAAPIWPSALMRSPTFRTPNARSDNGVLVDWPIEWDYVFESAYQLSGDPHYVL